MSDTQTIAPPFDIEVLRNEFPNISDTAASGRPIVYLDTAATAHKPLQVINRISEFYSKQNSNVHRGVHTLSAQATAYYEESRKEVQSFLHAESADEIVFTKGTTESVNLVAYTWGERNVGAGDEILLTEMEHHANIVPWQMLCERKSATIKIIPVLDNGELDMDAIDSLISEKTKIVAVTHVSNTLGTINDIATICDKARRHGIVSFVDGAQAVMHLEVDVQKIGCDFYAFSAHKLYGPTGVGILYGRKALLESMPPFMGGGAMIDTVTFQKTTYANAPGRFEAGTPNIAGIIGMAEAIRWFRKIDVNQLAAYEANCTSILLDTLRSIDNITVLGAAEHRIGIATFVADGAHAHDIGILLDEQGIAVRTGHHCTMPLLQRFGVQQTVRASLGAYSNQADVEAFGNALQKSLRMLQ